MITGEWTDEESEEVEEQNAKHDGMDHEGEGSIEEETVEKEESEVKEETDENVEKDTPDESNLGSPLKQELMEFLGMDNVDESASKSTVAEVKKDEIETSKNLEEEHDGMEEETEDIEHAMESINEESTTENVEDELAQLRKEMENAEEESVVKVEIGKVQDDKNEQITNSELQEQLENDVKLESFDSEPLAQDSEELPEQTKSSEAVKEPSKDALKSIITDWADEGEAQNDDI